MMAESSHAYSSILKLVDGHSPNTEMFNMNIRTKEFVEPSVLSIPTAYSHFQTSNSESQIQPFKSAAQRLVHISISAHVFLHIGFCLLNVSLPISALRPSNFESVSSELVAIALSWPLHLS
jgi:hypothetical protein